MFKQKARKLLDFVPMVILYGFAINLIYTISIGETYLQWKHYVGLAFLLTTTIFFFIKHPFGILCLGLMLIIGMVGLLSFDAAITTTTLSIGKSADNQIPVFFGQPIFILWLVIHFVVSGRYYVGILTEKYWSDLLHNTNQFPNNQSR